jgi:hypothetical protein
MTETLLPLPYRINETPSLLTPFLSHSKANHYYLFCAQNGPSITHSSRALHFVAGKAPGKRPKLDEKAGKLLGEDLQRRPWATHSQRAEILSAVCGVRVSEAKICRAIKHLSRTAEKKIRRSGRTRRVLKVLWRTEVGRVDPGRLVFVNEMGTTPRWLPFTPTHPQATGLLRGV